MAEIVQHMGGLYYYVTADPQGHSVFKKVMEDQESPLYVFWVEEVGWIAAQVWFESKAHMEEKPGLVAAYLGAEVANPSADTIHIPYWAKKKVQGAHLETLLQSTEKRTAIVNNFVCIETSFFAMHMSANIRPVFLKST